MSTCRTGFLLAMALIACASETRADLSEAHAARVRLLQEVPMAGFETVRNITDGIFPSSSSVDQLPSSYYTTGDSFDREVGDELIEALEKNDQVTGKN